MKKTHILLVAFVLVLAMIGIPYALAGTNYPSAGFDYMDPTAATIELEIIGVGNETLTAKGPTNISRSDPYDPGDGRWKIDTEIVSMTLTGTSSLVGPITIVQSPTRASNGAIQQQNAGVDFPADSFFDVFIEINTTLAFPLSTLHHNISVQMNATIYHIPPWSSIYISPPDPIPLYDEQNNHIGYIKHVSHKIPPIVGGTLIPVDKLALLAPWIVLAVAVTVAAVSVAVNRKKYRGF